MKAHVDFNRPYYTAQNPFVQTFLARIDRRERAHSSAALKTKHLPGGAPAAAAVPSPNGFRTDFGVPLPRTSRPLVRGFEQPATTVVRSRLPRANSARPNYRFARARWIISLHLGPDTSEARSGAEQFTFPAIRRFAGLVATKL
ncbi:hypothetical protein BRADI_2g01152v3 [Brachypodium distachyon]|uniref:Uncharacterized protein n=1 Tax=Brachypodium distachyon TaxID=15368 RepID=A0A2K2D6C2_BRADI|nr:hypothetical protein BRADI_2g01152v3 [Brachypodium distachyon]